MIAILSFCLLLCNTLIVSQPSCDMTSTQQALLFQQAMNFLTPSGWSIHDTGIMKFVRGNAYGNNPSSLYGIYEWLTIDVPLSWIGPQDAWVWIGCTPPDIQYFSARSYLYSAPNFDTLFASLGDSNNILTFNTTNGGPCNRTAVVITTADQYTAQTLSNAFIKAGLDPLAINIDIIPGTGLNLLFGRNLSTDLFTYLFRVALFHNLTDGYYYTNSTWPVYYIYPPDNSIAQPYPIPPLRPRDNHTNEVSFNTSLYTLVNQTIEFWNNFNSTVVNMDTLVPLPIEGYQCIANNTCCLGDNRDTSYLTSNNSYILSNDTSTFLMVLGINHVLTMDVIYANLDVNDDLTGDGIIGVTNKFWNGSAIHFGGESIPNANYLYGYAIARNCSKVGPALPYCLEVDFNLLPADHGMVIAERAYLQRSSKVGPKDTSLLMPIIMEFTVP